MYEDFFAHFGLQRNPFQVSPDSTHFYSTAAHDEALLQLVSRIEVHQGFLVLTGEAGTGKSTVLQYLLDWLKKYRYSSAYVFHAHVTFSDLLQMILEEFGVPFSATSKKDLLGILKNWLIDRHRVGDSPVILIDEAQSLKSRTLNELRRVLDLEVQGTALVQIVLAGQPRLEEKLQRHRLSRLQARVKWQCRLSALTPEETYGYISTRLAAAGAADAALFSTEALQQVYRYSKGIPRVINLLCEHACLATYGDGRNTVTGDDVWRAACQFELAGTADWKSETLQVETFCRLRRPKGIEAVETPAVEARAQENQEQLVAQVAEDSRGHEAAVDAVLVGVSEPALAVSQSQAEDLVTHARSTRESARESVIAINADTAPLSSTEAVEHVARPFECPSEPAFEPVIAMNMDTLRPGSNATAESLMEASCTSAPAPVSELAGEPASELIRERVHESARQVQPIASGVPPAVRERPNRRVIAQAEPMVFWGRFGMRFLQYWRGVARSFTRDLRQFLDECAGWLQGPMNIEQDGAALRRVAVSVSTWLKQPAGPGMVRRGHSSVPSTAHKHP
jgi:general secretion pathway protein A